MLQTSVVLEKLDLLEKDGCKLSSNRDVVLLENQRKEKIEELKASRDCGARGLLFPAAIVHPSWVPDPSWEPNEFSGANPASSRREPPRF